MSTSTSQDILGFIKEFFKTELNSDNTTLKKLDNLDSNLESDLMLDSLSLMDLIGQVDAHFDLSTSSEVDAISQLSTLKEVVNFFQKFLISSGSPSKSQPKLPIGPDTPVSTLKSPWFPPFAGMKQKESKMRMFCFYHAGGNPAVFRKWEMTLPASIEVVSVNLPGHQGRLEEKCLTDVKEIADRISMEIVPLIRSGKPFAFFGHSFGTLVAFESAVILRNKYGVYPSVFVASGRRFVFSSSSLIARAPQLEDPFQSELKTSLLNDNQFINSLSSRYEDSNIAKVKGIPEIMTKLLPSMRADMTAFENYSFDINDPAWYPFDFTLAVFAGDSDPRVNQQQLNDWKQVTKGKFVGTKFIKGNHFYIIDNAAPLIEEVQKILKDSIQGL